MREIKFRAWNKKYEEMIYLENSGLQYYDFEGNYSLGFTVDGYAGFWAHEQYEKATEIASTFPIMQYTGLKDVNGKEIYEGDIVKVKYHGEFIYGEIQYHCAGYCINFLKPREDGLLCNELNKYYDLENKPIALCELTVVGNTYENPELSGEK